MHLNVIGSPGSVGGANTELWHTIRLWRERGWSVTVIPTWTIDNAWRDRLGSLAVPVVDATAETIESVRLLAGSIVVSFCNEHFLGLLTRLRRMDCRTAFVPCMNWHFPIQRKRLPDPTGLADRIVCQSRYQMDRLLPYYRRHAEFVGQTWDDSRCRLIRGAFSIDEFPFEPRRHKPDEPFVVGRMSRAASDKFPLGSKNLWRQYERILAPKHCRVMGWDSEVEKDVGPAPAWAEALPQNTEPPLAFLRSLHCLCPGVGAHAKENWPRVGLEAMAAGVPIVAENAGGWPEMLTQGQNGTVTPAGLLAGTPDESSFLVSRLARDEKFRIEIAVSGRIEAERVADPDTIGVQWSALFDSLGG